MLYNLYIHFNKEKIYNRYVKHIFQTLSNPIGRGLTLIYKYLIKKKLSYNPISIQDIIKAPIIL